MSDLGPVRQIASPPLWIQVIHERNAANVQRGIRQSLRRVRNTFAVSEGCFPSRENPIGMLTEQFLNVVQVARSKGLRWLIKVLRGLVAKRPSRANK